MVVKERTTKKSLSGILKPDYEGYRRDKRRIESMALTAYQYERLAKKAAERRHV